MTSTRVLAVCPEHALAEECGPLLTIPDTFQDPRFSYGYPYEVELAHLGQGNWRAFRTIGISLPEILDIAGTWARVFDGIEKPWLCWNIDDDWSLIQQKLVASVGWTPVVGFDPRVGPPRQVIACAVVIDFNRELSLPILYPHFPLEFAFRYCDKLAFWHSDLLIRDRKIRDLAVLFEELKDGQTAATGSWAGWKKIFAAKEKRYWELVGCTTKGASRDQFEKGCGWWSHYWAHPNQKKRRLVHQQYYWDHGAGIYYWHRQEGGNCRLLSVSRFKEGHFTKLGNRNYRRYREPGSGSDARRSMADEIRLNFNLREACRELGLERYLARTSDPEG